MLRTFQLPSPEASIPPVKPCPAEDPSTGVFSFNSFHSGRTTRLWVLRDEGKTAKLGGREVYEDLHLKAYAHIKL